MRKQPSDRKLRRWLVTGRPRRVDRLLATDATTNARLDALSRLEPTHTAILADVSAPLAGFEERTVAAVRERIDTYATVALVADLLGLGWRAGQVILADPTPSTEPEPGDTPPT